MLMKAADVEVTLQRPAVRQRRFTIEPEQSGPVVGALRRRVDGARVAVEQLNRGRCSRPCRGGRGQSDQMQFGAIVLPAEISEQPRQIGRRFETPTIVVDALRGKISGVIPNAAAILNGCAATSE